MITKRIPIQFGDARDEYFLFPKNTAFDSTLEAGLKQAVETTPQMDGDIRLNGLMRDYKQPYGYNINFLFSDYGNINLDYLRQIMYGGPKKLFAYAIDADGSIEYYFSYASIEGSGLPEERVEAESELGQDYQKLNIKLKLLFPYWWKITGEIKYYSAASLNILYANTGLVANDGLYANSRETSSILNVSSLSNAQQTAAFHTCRQRTTPLSYYDRFIIPERISVGSTNVFDETISSAIEYHTTGDLPINSTAPNNVYLVKLDPLAEGEYVHITNTSTSSDLTITWTHYETNPNDIIYNSHMDICYDSSTGKEIPRDYYLVDYTESFLYFTNTIAKSSFLAKTTDSLIIQKDTSGNMNITIELLPSFH